MSEVEKLKIGSTDYDVRDANTLRSLNSTQATQIVTDGTYNGEAVENGEVFTNDTGKFQEFVKTEHTELTAVNRSLGTSEYLQSTASRVFSIPNGNTTLPYSTNGIDWSTSTLPTKGVATSSMTALISNGEHLLLIEEPNSRSWISDDGGDTWTYKDPVGLPSLSPSYLTEGFYLSSGIYVLKSRVNNRTLIYSSDRENWIDGSSSLPGTSDGLVCSDGTYAYFYELSTGNIYKTTDCVNWTSVGTSDFTYSNAYYWKMLYYQGKFWIYSTSSSFGGPVFTSLRYSTDCLHWTSVGTITSSLNSTFKGYGRLAYCGNGATGMFIIYVSKYNSGTKYYYTSQDGISWTEQQTPSNYNNSDLAATQTFFYLGSSGNSSYKGSYLPYYTYALTDLSMTASEVNSQGFLKNTATGTGLAILGTTTTGVAIGPSSQANAISGYSNNSVALGKSSQASGWSVSLGSQSSSTYGGVAVGADSQASGDMYYGGVALGLGAQASGTLSVAIGSKVRATGYGSIQLGWFGSTGSATPTNSEAGTFCVGLGGQNNYKLLNSDGTIPAARLTNAIQGALTSTTVTLAAADWSSNTQTVSVTGMTATKIVWVSPAGSSMSDYADGGVYCSAQGSGTLTFTCSTAPTNDLTVQIVFG